MRWWGLALLLFSLVGLLTACSSGKAPEAATGDTLLIDSPRREGREAIMVLTPFSAPTKELWTSLRGELAEDFDVVTMRMEEGISSELIAARISQIDPKCIVLMDNRSVRAFHRLQAEGYKTPPAIVLMSSFAEHLVARLNNATGIAYEVPGVTSFVALRTLYKKPVTRVGVLYRPALRAYVERQAALAKMEEVELVGIEVEGEPSPRALRRALRKLFRQEKAEALWVLNDNVLLSPHLVRNAWLPEIRVHRVPVIVGVSSLVNSQLRFGSLAVLPDHEALGVQAANLLFEMADDGWRLQNGSVEPPFSIQTVVDMSQSDELELIPEAESNIDTQVF